MPKLKHTLDHILILHLGKSNNGFISSGGITTVYSFATLIIYHF